MRHHEWVLQTLDVQGKEKKVVKDLTDKMMTAADEERFEVAAVTKASELVQQGAIGRVVQTVGLGPHRLNRATRSTQPASGTAGTPIRPTGRLA